MKQEKNDIIKDFKKWCNFQVMSIEMTEERWKKGKFNDSEIDIDDIQDWFCNYIENRYMLKMNHNNMKTDILHELVEKLKDPDGKYFIADRLLKKWGIEKQNKDIKEMDGNCRSIMIVFQVNGKTVDHVEILSGLSEGCLKAMAIGFSTVDNAIAGRNVLDIVVIPDKLVNVITSSKEKETSMKQEKGDKSFKTELENLINRYYMDNKCDLPDFILAEYIIGCFKNFSSTLNMWEKWCEKKRKDGDDPRKVFHSMQEVIDEYQPDSKLEIKVVPKDKNKIKDSK